MCGALYVTMLWTPKLTLPPFFLLALFACISASFSACSRRAEKTNLVDANLTFGPMGKDTSLSLSPPTNAEMRALLEISGQEMRTADYLRIVDHLNELSRVSNRDNLRFLAKKMHSAFYDAPSNFEKTGLAGSLYIDAAIGEGEPIVRPFLHQARIDLDSLLQKVSLLLRQSQSLFPWPSKLENLAQTLELSDLYIGWVSEKLPSLPLPENLKDTLRKAMDGAYKNFRPRVWNNILRMQEAKSQIGRAHV